MQAEDPLSRRSDHEGGVKVDYEEQILLKPEYFAISAIDSHHATLINDDKILREVKEALLDDKVTKNYNALLDSGPREFKKGLQEWNHEDGLILFRGKTYVPDDLQLRPDFVKMYHDNPAFGHPGRHKTYELVTREFWWPGMSIFIREYVKGCATCQANKINTHPSTATLQPNEINVE